MKRKPICGVYLMVDASTDAHYVGGSIDCPGRWKWHRECFKKGAHWLQKEFGAAFTNGSLAFFVLEQCAPDDLRATEYKWMRAFPFRANKSPNVTRKGIKLSPEHAKRLRESNIGNTYRKGTISSAATKKKLSKLMMGNQYLLGHKHSEETKAKIGKAALGNKYLLGHVHSKTTRKKLSESIKRMWRVKKHIKRVCEDLGLA